MAKAVLKSILIAAAICAVALPSARAEIRILASPGGPVGPFLQLFERVRASGERVVIDGPCLSACTLVLDMVPSNRICVTRRAILGFHAARSVDQQGRINLSRKAVTNPGSENEGRREGAGTGGGRGGGRDFRGGYRR